MTNNTTGVTEHVVRDAQVLAADEPHTTARAAATVVTTMARASPRRKCKAFVHAHDGTVERLERASASRGNARLWTEQLSDEPRQARSDALAAAAVCASVQRFREHNRFATIAAHHQLREWHQCKAHDSDEHASGRKLHVCDACYVVDENGRAARAVTRADGDAVVDAVERYGAGVVTAKLGTPSDLDCTTREYRLTYAVSSF